MCLCLTKVRAPVTMRTPFCVCECVCVCVCVCVCACVCVCVHILQGPPGTGKTATIVQFISLLIQQLGYRRGPILACAQSNVVVDNLLQGLCDRGVSRSCYFALMYVLHACMHIVMYPCIQDMTRHASLCADACARLPRQDTRMHVLPIAAEFVSCM